jgi:hypothetical protein
MASDKGRASNTELQSAVDAIGEPERAHSIDEDGRKIPGMLRKARRRREQRERERDDEGHQRRCARPQQQDGPRLDGIAPAA